MKDHSFLMNSKYIGEWLLSKITSHTLFVIYGAICFLFFYPTIGRLVPILNPIIGYSRYAILGLIIFFLFFDLILRRDWKITVDFFQGVIAVYILWALATLILKGGAYIGLGFKEFFFMFYSMTIAWVTIQLFNKKQMSYIIRAFVIIAIINSLYMVTEILRGELVLRALFADRNILVRFLIIPHVWILISLFSSKNRVPSQIIPRVATLFLILFAVIMSLSRGGYILYAFATFVVIIATRNKKIILPGLFLGTFMLLIFSAMILYRIKRDNMDVRNVSDLGRISAMASGINMIKAHPIVGVGYGTHTHRFVHYQNKRLPGLQGMETIHNIYVVLWAETGLIGLLLYLIFNFGLIIALFKKFFLSKRPITEVRFELLTMISLCTYMIHGLVYHMFNSEGFYWFIVFFAVYSLWDEAEVSHQQPLSYSE